MIEVLLFAHLRDGVGTAKLEINTESLTVEQLKDKLVHDFGLPDLDRVMVAINEEYASNQDQIKNGDTVALIPHVSGG
ncbi:molybdopterin converting factor subunit 1 [Radiobacillus kanasensis]|uniref:molybdopterin converting factor subunit 1 n=1 Tax=Radiobacillus kanasensis TaxID=2844358 RepID=UPI001E550FDA|nr:molybdopterin converting factor subunit 1 [Radiobacillus kanasensis]UFT98309.1 molybdopterin converting factor subunit 1 [Radiobacillus kanasensis]